MVYDESRRRYGEKGNKLIGLQGKPKGTYTSSKKLYRGPGYRIPGTTVRYWIYEAQISEILSLIELEDYDALREVLLDIKQMQKIPFKNDAARKLLGENAMVEEF